MSYGTYDSNVPWLVGTVFELIEPMNSDVFDNPVGTQVVLMEIGRPDIHWRYHIMDQDHETWIVSNAELLTHFKEVKL